MADPLPLRIEPPPVILRDDRTLTVPSWPLPLQGVQDRTVDLVSGEGDTMLLVPRKSGRSKGVILAFLVLTPSLLVLGFTMSLMVQEARGIGLIFVGFFGLLIAGLFGFLLLGWLSSGLWIKFDRASGLISQSRRPFGFYRSPRVFRTFPMAEVVGVQMIYNGYHTTETQVGDSDRPTTLFAHFHSYQLNLLIQGETLSRMNLAHHSDWAWMRAEGGRLAGYLGVPVADQLQHGG